MMITRDILRQWGACYSDDEIASLVPEDGLTPLQVADMADVPVTDRIWVLLRPEVLGDALRPVLDGFVERAIRRVLGRSGVPEWEAWAQAWLSGDRSAAAADAATRAAWYAADADAADAAARAAWYAADAAARAAYAAAWSAADSAWYADECIQQLADIRASLA